jgi:ATP-dependent DNA helicase RecG
MTDALRLASDIADVPGVGARSRVAFARLGIATVGDLLKHLPLRYETHKAATSIGETDRTVPRLLEGTTKDVIVVTGEIAALRIQPGRRHRIEATLDDGTGTVRLVWFNAPWLAKKLHAGQPGTASGKAKRFHGYLEMTNPTWTPTDTALAATPSAEAGAAADDRLRPVYPANEDLSSQRIERAVESVLEAAIPQIVDALPAPLRDARRLMPLADAYRTLHRPPEPGAIEGARRRLAYDELFLLQLGVMLKRSHVRVENLAPALPGSPAIDARIRARLPFTLTKDQDRVIAEIVEDLGGTVPMNRLLQGDVGSGKTAVAAYAALVAVAHRHQAAIMAPTEILAEQHFSSLQALLASSDVRIELLTGAKKGKARAATVEAIASGDAPIVVGTHALLSDDVSFRALGLAVIDEQHRFGVAQRAVLRGKRGDGDTTRPLIPHTLVMTATPIPRTLALTVFGDLDVSTIREMPPGRAPVATRWLLPSESAVAYADVAARLDRGERAFVVVPAIDESDIGLADVSSHLARLADGPLRGRRLAPMHGRLSQSERDDVMRRFRTGDLDAIVATTVIEVGVDVPEATVIVIEHADRFGLAQLHQLRGRVGRGQRPGTCYLIGEPLTDDARKRLEALVETTDGFRLAELDLAIRGPGELVGARQSGLPPFRVADLTRDLAILRDARDDAAALVQRDRRLAQAEHALLKRKLLATYGEALGLVDVG